MLINAKLCLRTTKRSIGAQLRAVLMLPRKRNQVPKICAPANVATNFVLNAVITGMNQSPAPVSNNGKTAAIRKHFSGLWNMQNRVHRVKRILRKTAAATIS